MAATLTPGLVQASDGNFYGTTFGRGANGYGTVFKITPAGALTRCTAFVLKRTVLTANTPTRIGASQRRELLWHNPQGGGGQYHQGGTIFKITPSGTLTTIYNFCSQPNCTDGSDSLAGLIQTTDSLLRDDDPWRGQLHTEQRLWHGLKSPQRHAEHAVQLRRHG